MRAPRRDRWRKDPTALAENLRAVKIVTGKQMAEIDRRTIQDLGLDGQVLMETAGRSVAAWLGGRLSARARVAFLCGPGNNGGDGFVAARAWADGGGRPELFLYAEPDQYKGDAALNLERARRWGLPLRSWSELPASWDGYAFVVDALFGTGLTRKLAPELVGMIEGLPRERTLAVDIPSGLDSATGQALGGAVRAAATLTFGLPKLGQLLHPGRDYCGELEIVPIGFPRKFLESDEWPGTWVTSAVARNWWPHRNKQWHKGKSGKVLLLAGSDRYPGAGVLAALGALRGGAGIVYLMAPARVCEALLAVAPEAIPISAETLTVQEVQEHLDGVDAWCVGPGLGQEANTQQVVRQLLAESPLPVVVDADALRALPEQLGPHALLTPHHGELARIAHGKVADVERDRLGVAARTARNARANVLLKGAPTLVVSPNGSFALSDTGTPVLAQGGSGDVLSGLATALLGQGLSAWQAGALAAYVHGRAGQIPGVPAGLGARHLAEHLPLALAELVNSSP